MKVPIKTLLVTAIVLPIFLSCEKDSNNAQTFEYDFSRGKEGWNVLFSDYPLNNETFYELTFEEATLPPPLTNRNSLRVGGNNHSDDLLSMIYKKIEGLSPNTTYQVSFSVDIASNAISNSPGAGGSPDLTLGGGGLSYQPGNNIDPQNYYRPNFESRIQSGSSNEVLTALGKIGVSPTHTDYKLVNRNNLSNPIAVRTNANGELWVLVGTDSGFEGITVLYYSKIKVIIKN